MLRYFSDCIDLSDNGGDGWIVIDALLKAPNKERIPVSDMIVGWILNIADTDEYQLVRPKLVTLWLQRTVREFVAHERDHNMFRRLLISDGDIDVNINESHATSIAQWLSLRASQQEVLPIIIEAGRSLHLDGFDWVIDSITPTEYIRSSSNLFSIWFNALQNGIDTMKELITFEMAEVLPKVSWAPQFLSDFIVKDHDSKAQDFNGSLACSICKDDYSILQAGLVSPRVISFTECNKTNHRIGCECSEYVKKIGVTMNLNDMLEDSESDNEIDEEISKEAVPVSQLYDKYTREEKPDPF
jgi:hypothetical protein